MDVGFFAPTAVVFLAIDRDQDFIYLYGDGLTARRYKVFGNCVSSWKSGVCICRNEEGKIEKGNYRLMNALEFKMLDELH